MIKAAKDTLGRQRLCERSANTANFSWGIVKFSLRGAKVMTVCSSLARHSRREWRAREEPKISGGDVSAVP
jgi:hypothetical protein